MIAPDSLEHPVSSELLDVLDKAKQIAKRYRELTGRPLGITGEIGELEAARLLGLELADVRQAGYDAIRRTNDGIEKLQVKTRYVPPNIKPGQRMGRIDLAKEWDTVLLVLLDENFDADCLPLVARYRCQLARTCLAAV